MDLQEFGRVRKDPWKFFHYVNTLDQVDPINPIKKFPVYLDYLELYTKLWMRERLVAVPKSRRMKMSWTNIGLYLWDTLFHVGRANAFVSKKEDDSNELIDRAEFIYKNCEIPKNMLPKLNRKYGLLEFPEINSNIRGFAQGADQLRQFTFSGIFGDESAFWEDAQKFYAASFPTIEGGGRMTLVSSPAPGFFKRLVHDQLDQSR